MKVVLIKDVKRLGEKGVQVEVKDGYARNFLIPNELALLATENNAKKIKEILKQQGKSQDKLKKQSQDLKETLEKLSLTISAEVKDGEEIYGSVTDVQILGLLKEQGIVIKKENLRLDSPIKKLGIYHINVELFPEVTANLRVWVVKK